MRKITEAHLVGDCRRKRMRIGSVNALSGIAAILPGAIADRVILRDEVGVALRIIGIDKEAVVIGEPIVETKAKSVYIVLVGNRCNIVLQRAARSARQIGSRIFRRESLGTGIEAVVGNLVIRERVAAKRIDDGGKPGEVAALHGVGR